MLQDRLFIVFPNQLFYDNANVLACSSVLLAEEPRFFLDFKYNQKKLLLHRASMQAYKDYLIKKGLQVHYADFQEITEPDFYRNFIRKNKFKEISLFDPEDFFLENIIDTIAEDASLKVSILPNPQFICSKQDIWQLFVNKKHYNMTGFYIRMRKNLNILIDQNGKPVGGKWTYDTANRKPIPKDIKIPDVPCAVNAPDLIDSAEYVLKYFHSNPGSVDNFIYPINNKQAISWLDNFLNNRLKNFGDYEDAISTERVFLFHSVLSSSLNIGLVTPEEVVRRTLDYADKNDIPINSLEGFIRQVIGWREFMRAVYVMENKKMRLGNFWNFNYKMPDSFYYGTTGIEPVDCIVKKFIKHGYANHIERLMILGSFMLLCRIHPDYVYRWFMEFSIDSYDWVMVPNVYGMSQYSRGGLMTTKPYICSSNYILKMSNFAKGDWCHIWDSLFWSFVDKYRMMLTKNPRSKILTYHLDKFSKEKLMGYKITADLYLKRIHRKK